MNEPNTPAFKAPYFRFQTFWGFIDELASKPLPPQIDRSMLVSKSGSDQAQLLSALKGFDLITDAQVVKPSLEMLVAADPAGRKPILEKLLRERYPNQFAVSDQNGTEKQLLDSFDEDFGVNGETRRKAVTFFLHAARTAGIELSSYFPATRTGSGAPAGTRARRTPKPKRPAEEAGSASNGAGTPPAHGDTYTVTLRAGGTVTLTVNVSHFALSKNKGDRDFVNSLIDALIGYVNVETSSTGEEVSEL